MFFEPDLKFYTTCSVVGRCFYDKGVVLLSKHQKSGSLVAIKSFNLEEVSQDEYNLIQKEVLLMRQLKHTNIVSCLTSYIVDCNLYIVSHLHGFGSCYDLISAHFQSGLPENVIAYVLRDVLHALDYLHSRGYIHRAVKARHILINAKGRARLSGLRYMCPFTRSSLGISKVHDFPTYATLNLNWLSPELLEQNTEGYNEKSDIYSVGITACELANGTVPFAETSTTLMLTEKIRGVIPQLLDCTTWFSINDNESGENENIDKVSQCKATSRKFSGPFHGFVELSCERSVTLRPSANHLLNHSFFKQVRRFTNNVSELLQPAVPMMESNIVEFDDDISMSIISQKLKDINVDVKMWEFDESQ